jgi:hypothetical protein
MLPERLKKRLVCTVHRVTVRLLGWDQVRTGGEEGEDSGSIIVKNAPPTHDIPR